MRALREADALVISQGKSGRTWLRAMLSHLYHRRCGIPASELLDGGNFHARDPRAPRVLFTHDGPEEPWNRDRAEALRAFARKRVVFLARDPRDMAVSTYHHAATRASPEARAREGLAAGGDGPTLFDYVALRDGGKLRQIIGYLNAWAERLPRLPRALLVTYEGMRADPHAELRRVAEFVDGPFAPEEIEHAVAFAAFESLREKERSGFFRSFRLRPADPADPRSYKVRRGRVGGYREDFTAEQVAVLDAIVAAELSPFYDYGPRASRRRSDGPQSAAAVRSAEGA